MSRIVAISERARRVPRTALTAIGVIAVLSASARTAEAQPSPRQPATWEVVVPSGAFVPSGAQQDALKGAAMSAVQVSYVARPSFAITSTFEWARSRDRASAGDPQLDVFTASLGGEVRAPKWFEGRAVTFSPFAGAGAGVRSYNYRKLDVGATHNLAGYGAVGGDIGIRRVHLRLEVRDYVTGFKPLVGAGKSDARNDLAFMVALRFNLRRALQD